MIARTWRGAVRREDADPYAEYLQATGVAGYAATAGNRGVWMLRRDLGELTEFVMFTLWDRWTACADSPGMIPRRPSSTRRTTASWSNGTCERPTSRSTRTWPIKLPDLGG